MPASLPLKSCSSANRTQPWRSGSTWLRPSSRRRGGPLTMPHLGASPPPGTRCLPAPITHPALEAADAGASAGKSEGGGLPPHRVPSLPSRQLCLPFLLAEGLAGGGKGRPGPPGECGSSTVPPGPHAGSFPEPCLVRHMGQDSMAPGLAQLVPWRRPLLQQMITAIVSQVPRTLRLHTYCPTGEKQSSEMKKHHHPPQSALCRGSWFYFE